MIGASGAVVSGWLVLERGRGADPLGHIVRPLILKIDLIFWFLVARIVLP